MGFSGNTKVIGSGLGGTIAGLIIDVLEGRFDVLLSSGELNAIIVASAMIAGWLMPDPEQRANVEMIDRLKTRLDAITGPEPPPRPPAAITQ